MIAPDKGLISYADRYLLGRSVTANYAKTLRTQVAAYADWCGGDPGIDSLCMEHVNEWLTELDESGVSVWSLRGYRQAILSIWNAAFDAGDNPHPPLRVKLFKRPRVVVEAYTHEEIHTLLDHVLRVNKKHSDGNHARDFWQAAIHVAYCCGPRRGDLLRVKRKQVSADGTLSFVQHKTGFPHRVKLSTAAREYCSQLRGSMLLPWPYQPDYFSKTFAKLRKAAGITRGSFKWIRRSAGSYAERECPGAGARLLGHRDESVFRRFYEDTSISSTLPPQPPPLTG